MSAANFDCAKLLQVKLKIDQLWQDSMVNQDYIAQVDALLTLQSNQRGANFEVLRDPTKDKDVKVIWLTDCETDEVQDCSADCELDGNEIGDNCKDYNLNFCKEISFKIGRYKYRTSMWSPEEVTARAFLAKMKQIDEYIVETVVSKLDSFAALATNQFVPNYMAQGGGDTTIPAAYWTPNLMGYMVEAAIKNKMRDAYMLSGSNLFQQAWMVAQQQPNAQGGQADLNKMNTFKKYFDLFNIDSVLGTQKTFLIRPSALAFVSKNYNTNAAPIFIGGSTGNDIYYQTSKNLPFVNYDVTHTVKCEEVNGQTEYFDIYKLKVKFDLLDNPVGCSGEMRGLLSFKCGEIS